MNNPFNPWHHVSPGQLLPDAVNAIIEIPKGTRAKYELDPESGLIRLDRVLSSAVYYPFNYGFIPQTYGEDFDPLDILVLSQIEIVPLCIVPARIIGVVRIVADGEGEDKIIAVAIGDPSVNHMQDLSDIPVHFRAEMASFFEDYKKLEMKTVVVEEFSDKARALQILQESYGAYKTAFPK